MIQDTAWSPRFVPSTTATAATSGEAIAGTDTTKFITPSLLPAATSYHAGPVVNARAPRQGLVLDGSNSGSATMGSSIGDSSATVDLLLDIPSSNPATSRGVFTIGPNSVSANYANTFDAELRTDGKLWVNLTGSTTNDYRRVESSSSLVSLFGGKRVRLTVVRDSSAATLAVYVNAVALATTETTGGTAPAWSGSVTGTYFVPGRISASEIHVGYFSLVGFYNRALSASEVVALYESGAPSGADYNSASNTSIAVAATNGNFGGFSSTANSITATSTGGTGYCYIPIPLVKGYKYRIQFTSAVAYSGNSLVWRFLGDPGSGSISGTWSNAVNCTPNAGVLQITSTSAASAEFTPDSSDSTAFLHLWEVGITAGSNVSQSGISVTRLGLLLAPDAAQAGGGLTWYDTSGNAANITLPASGVSWNVPSSFNFGRSITSFGGTSDPAWSFLASNGTQNGYALYSSGASANQKYWFIQSGSAVGDGLLRIRALNDALTDGINAIVLRRSGTTSTTTEIVGKLFIATNGVDSGGLLQVGTDTTTAANGMKFGTDVSVYRSGTRELTFLGANSSTFVFAGTALGATTTIKLGDGTNNDQSVIESTGSGSLVFKRNATTALTLDSSQQAKFSSAVYCNTTTQSSGVVGAKLITKQTSGTNDWTVTLDGNPDGVAGASYGLRILAGTNSSDYPLYIRNQTNTTTLLAVKGSGRVNMGALPTSSTGLSAGDIWNDAGTLKIV